MSRSVVQAQAAERAHRGEAARRPMPFAWLALAAICVLPATAIGAPPRSKTPTQSAPARKGKLPADKAARPAPVPKSPVGSIARTEARPTAPATPATTDGNPPCGGATLARQSAGLPFAAGEELSYDLTYSGLYIGRVEMKVGAQRSWGGRPALALFARARTSAFTSAFKEASGRYMTLVDPDTLRPFALRVESTYGTDPRHEHVRFKDETRVNSSFMSYGKKGKRDFEGLTPIYDALSIIYYARTRVLQPGASVCHEVFGDRRMWRLEAKVKGRDTFDTPAGDKDVIVVETVFEALPHPDIDPNRPKARVELDLYLADDEARAPLAFVVRNRGVTARGQLVSWSLRGKSQERDWDL